jgi:O-antigen ligase
MMAVKTNNPIEIGSLLISIILVAVFYMVFMMGLVSNQDVMQNLILLVLTIVCLFIFSLLARIEAILRRGMK